MFVIVVIMPQKFSFSFGHLLAVCAVHSLGTRSTICCILQMIVDFTMMLMNVTFHMKFVPVI